jgi:hypothetical protein
VRLYFDEDADARLAEALRRRGFNVETTASARRLRMPDEAQLTYAASQQRALVTHNVKDFPRIHAEWLAAGREHWGIILLIGQPSIGAWLRRMERLLSRVSAAEWRSRLVFLSAEYDEPEAI